MADYAPEFWKVNRDILIDDPELCVTYSDEISFGKVVMFTDKLLTEWEVVVDVFFKTILVEPRDPRLFNIYRSHMMLTRDKLTFNRPLRTYAQCSFETDVTDDVLNRFISTLIDHQDVVDVISVDFDKSLIKPPYFALKAVMYHCNLSEEEITSDDVETFHDIGKPEGL